jgi:Xaa-Pro aminopeptidase
VAPPGVGPRDRPASCGRTPSRQSPGKRIGALPRSSYSDRVSEPNPAPPVTGTHDQPVPEAYAAFMRQGWGERELELPRLEVADWSVGRRSRLAEAFPGERLVVPAGGYKVRSNDTDYRFRADTAHVYLSGNQTSDAVLVVEDGEAVLYARPRSSRTTDEFFRDRRYGELWAGRRPSLQEMSDSLGLEVRHLAELDDRLGRSTKTRVLRGVDLFVDRCVPADPGLDADFARVLSEMRLVKDPWELEQLQEACDITALGFADGVREWDGVLEHGERWLEGTFFRRARAMGNDLGYDSIVAGGSHATTLHWTENSGPVRPGELLLLDMGVEGRNLYTADVTRTLPVDGTFTPVQRELYSLVLTAQQAGIDAVRPGAAFQAPGPAARVGGGGAVAGQQGLHAVDPALDQPHARSRRPRLRLGGARCLQGRRPGGGHGADRGARAVLPGGRPPGPRGAARHRHPHRGRPRGDRRGLEKPVRGPAPRSRRGRAVDGRTRRLRALDTVVPIWLGPRSSAG